MEALIALLKADTNAANAFGALASAAAAILALVVSVISVWISVRTAKMQQVHNALTVRPLAEVTLANYENSLRVRVHNNGVGPLILNAINVSDGRTTLPSLIEWMPELPGGRPWNDYSKNFQQRSLAVGTFLTLIELTERESETYFSDCRDLVRRSLEPLAVTVEYTDIYGTTMPSVQKSLNWFGVNKA